MLGIAWTYEFWSSSWKSFRINRALSPYDRIVDMPTRTSEKLMKMGDRVTLWDVSAVEGSGKDRHLHQIA